MRAWPWGLLPLGLPASRPTGNRACCVSPPVRGDLCGSLSTLGQRQSDPVCGDKTGDGLFITTALTLLTSLLPVHISVIRVTS